ncbi:MAG TPA: formyltransferase family protein [Gammaproteobacteria bacterium]
MNVFFVGSAGPLSVEPFQWLLSSEHVLCGVGLDWQEPANWPGQVGLTQLTLEHNTLASLARAHQLSLVDLNNDDTSEVAARIRALNPDLILVSCYGRKVPDQILQVARHGGINCHPSLLPSYRGPAPLFWQYREGIDPLGVSLHVMNSEWDAGDVIASTTLEVVDGLPGAYIQLRLSEALCDLLAQTLERFPDGLSPIAQQQKDASYHGAPGPADFQVQTKWSARRIFNFMRATEHWGYAYPCEVNGRHYELKHALVFSADNQADLLPNNSEVLHFECNPGLMVASYYH